MEAGWSLWIGCHLSSERPCPVHVGDMEAGWSLWIGASDDRHVTALHRTTRLDSTRRSMIDGGGGEAHGGAAAALAAAAAAAYGNKSFFQKNNKIENKEGNPTHRSRGPRRTHFKREPRAVITVRNSAATPGERVSDLFANK